jgi:hypothetical chaperone protein
LQHTAIGLDFGTTNSSIALVRPDGHVEVARFAYRGSTTESFRSLLYLERVREGHRTTIKSWSGPEGIERYLDADEKGRLVQSLKSFLSARGLKTTEIFGRSFKLEQLVTNILRDIRRQAEQQFGLKIEAAVVGRPVHFVGAESPADDEFAVQRLTEALTDAGLKRVVFEYEPVAAAYHYESMLDRDELIIIGDFGGGTSDFSVLRVGPTARRLSRDSREVLGNEGVGLAGDAFDARIVRHLVSPALGAGSELDSGGKLLPVPTWVYFKLERWHHLSFLRSAETLAMLKSVAAQAVEPEKLQALLYLVKHDLGYQLHQAVQRAKVTLSHAERTAFRFAHADLAIHAEITRAAFENWIRPELLAIEHTVDRLLSNAGILPPQVDRVFLTGGSSLVPAVRRIFESRFGREKISAGDEFTSVARGLALRATNVTA